jgi:hypothetical protein
MEHSQPAACLSAGGTSQSTIPPFSNWYALRWRLPRGIGFDEARDAVLDVIDRLTLTRSSR